jgi:hypothetical protein
VGERFRARGSPKRVLRARGSRTARLFCHRPQGRPRARSNAQCNSHEGRRCGTNFEDNVVDASRGRLDHIRATNRVPWLDHTRSRGVRVSIAQQQSIGVRATRGNIVVFIVSDVAYDQQVVSIGGRSVVLIELIAGQGLSSLINVSIGRVNGPCLLTMPVVMTRSERVVPPALVSCTNAVNRVGRRSSSDGSPPAGIRTVILRSA